MAEAPLAMLGWSGRCVVALKATTAFAPHSHVTSQPFGVVALKATTAFDPAWQSWPVK